MLQEEQVTGRSFSLPNLTWFRPRALVACALVAGLIVGACASTRLKRSLKTVGEVQTVDRRSAYLKVHAKDGQLYVLSEWRVDEAAREISGRGERLSLARETLESGPLTVSLDDVALVETNVIQRSPAVAALAVVTGISATVTAFCIAQPKSCFGSCPTFYVEGAAGALLQAEGFSSSVAPSLEARDVDALYRARPSTDGRLTVTMKNEALETHVVRHVRLLAAPQPMGGRVLATLDGEFREATDVRALRTCDAEEGDCLSKVQAFDSIERFSLTDGEDLARRETIELQLAPAEGPRGLVIASRQSLASTFLFYQSLAYLGHSAGVTIAALERGDRSIGSALARLQQVLGGIEVAVETASGEWTSAGEVREMGPLATDLVVVPLPRNATGRVRLRLARGHWRLDYLASARLGPRVEPAVLEPTSVRDGAGRSIQAGAVITLPGDTYTYTFDVPAGSTHELFLDSRGYYLEWMRQEWLADENPRRAAQLLLDPEQLLRDLAPEFKRQEAQMETLFWGSRYARQ
jgi:hypothetical protein